MFDHVTIRASDLEASKRFYELVLATLGHSTLTSELGHEWGDFSVGLVDTENPVSRRLHIGFFAASRAQVDEFWRVGTEAGYRDDGAPGLRPEYSDSYYGAFLLDPDGNSAEAVTHDDPQRDSIDHVWVRVADLDASARFYETIAPYAGFRRGGTGSDPDRVHFRSGRGGFSVVADEPRTAHVHIAFPASDNATVDAFHRTATEAGYRDNGGPGERPVYHAGYYGAFVLDPDGNNIEVVNHNR